MVCIMLASDPGDWMCRSACGAPLTSSTGISVKDPKSEAELLCAPLLGSPCRWPCFVSEGWSCAWLCLVLDPSLKEPDVLVRMDSGESASSLARDRLLCREEENILLFNISKY